MKQKRLFTWKWFLTTVLVLVAMAVMIRLGVWQLDRLAQRRAFNAHVITQSNLPALDLTGKAPFQDLTGMEYRKAVVRGKYLLDQAIVLRNQYWNGQYGVHLLTPLLIEGSRQAIMVDRG